MNTPPLKAVDTAAESTPDPFDLASLRLTQDFASTAGVKKHVNQIPVRKPSPQEFIRVHPDADYRLNVTAIQLKEEGETYVVAGHAADALVAETVPLTVYTTINRQGTLTLWPIRLPGPDGKDLDWWKSARSAAELAMTKWTRIKANKSLAGYDIVTAEVVVTEPEWPTLSFQQIIKIAFRDKLITSLDHPVVKRLQGLM
jgi:hypothetical protein